MIRFPVAASEYTTGGWPLRPTTLGDQPASTPFVSTAARHLCGVGPICVNEPPRYTVPPSAASEVTVLLGDGFQSVTSPVLTSIAAAPERRRAFVTLNWPPSTIPPGSGAIA